MWVVGIVLWLLGTATCGGLHAYKIIKVNETFRFPDHYRWRIMTYTHSPGHAMYPYSTMRVDSTTAKWNLSNEQEVNDELLKVFNDSSVRCPIFNPFRFLSMLQNKVMGVLGDSIARQMFDGLQNCLTTYLTEYRNETYVFPQAERAVKSVYFAQFNATIYICFDPFVLFNQSDPCIIHYYSASTDIIVFGIGAHYKPKHIMSHRYDNVSYYESFDLSQIALREDAKRAREYVKHVNPNVKVIWRLQSHVGYIDELHFLHNITGRNADSKRWSNVSLCSHWVPFYNDIIVKQASVYADPVMDWFTLSNQYIQYFSHGMGIPTHIDSIHFFTDGVPRGAALLLQDAIYDVYNGNGSET